MNYTSSEENRKKELREFYGLLLTGVTISLAIFGFIIAILRENIAVELLLLYVFILGYLTAMVSSSFLDYINNMNFLQIKIIIQTILFTIGIGFLTLYFVIILFLSSEAFEKHLGSGVNFFLFGFIVYIILWIIASLSKE